MAAFRRVCEECNEVIDEESSEEDIDTCHGCKKVSLCEECSYFYPVTYYCKACKQQVCWLCNAFTEDENDVYECDWDHRKPRILCCYCVYTCFNKCGGSGEWCTVCVKEKDDRVTEENLLFCSTKDCIRMFCSECAATELSKDDKDGNLYCKDCTENRLAINEKRLRSEKDDNVHDTDSKSARCE